MDSGYEFTPPPDKVPETQPAFSGGPPQPPPRPPKLTACDLLEPGDSGKRIFLPDYIEIRDFAELLGVRPFKLVAEVLRLRIFKHSNEFLDFSTASRIAAKHGLIVEKLL